MKSRNNKIDRTVYFIFKVLCLREENVAVKDVLDSFYNLTPGLNRKRDTDLRSSITINTFTCKLCSAFHFIYICVLLLWHFIHLELQE